jgi:type IV pilus assembly protein PilM
VRVPLVYKVTPQFGFDIGNHTIKVAQLRQSGHTTVVQAYGSGFFPREAIAEGIIVDPEEIAKAITPLLHKLTYGKLTAGQAIVGLPAAKLFTRTLQLPPMDGSDLAQAVHYEVEQYVPMPTTDLYVDYETISTGADGQLNVLMMAAPRAIVDSYLKLFEILALEVSAVEANMTAVVRALLHSGDVTGSSLVIDIGSISSDLTIYDKFIPLTGSVPVGGEHFTQALMKQLGIKLDQANEIKEKFGIGPSGMHDKVVVALQPQFQAVIKEARRVVKFYQSRSSSQQKVGSMVLSGGSACMPGLADYFSHEIGLPLTTANPWNHLRLHQPPTAHTKQAPMYATAVGLALRGLL